MRRSHNLDKDIGDAKKNCYEKKELHLLREWLDSSPHRNPHFVNLERTVSPSGRFMIYNYIGQQPIVIYLIYGQEL